MKKKNIVFLGILHFLCMSCKDAKFHRNYSRSVVTDINFSSSPNELPIEFFIKVNRELKYSFPNLKIAVYPNSGGYSTMVVSESNDEELDDKLIDKINKRTQIFLESISLGKEKGAMKSLVE